MSRLDWLRRTFVESGASLLQVRKSLGGHGLRRRKTAAPSIVEGLEDRTLLTAFVVNTTSDDADDAAGVNDGLISLREAIIAANTNAAFGDAPAGSFNGDSIQFDTSVFSGSDAARTISVQNGVFIVTDDLRIIGPAADVIIDANSNDRAFRIVSNQFTSLQDVTIRNARSVDGAGGGAIRITGGGRTILTRVTIENSTAVGRGGAILVVGSTLETFNSQFLNNAAGTGGALASVAGSVVTLNGTLVEDNVAAGVGGGLSNDGGRLILRSSVVSSNTANSGAGLLGGGGVHNTNNGRLSISGSDLIGNRAANARGGAIYSSSGGVSIGDSVISENFAGQSGGGIEIIHGDLDMVRTQLGGAGDGTGNVTNGDGGGLRNGGTARVVINDSSIQFNEAGEEGGGLWNSARGTLIVQGRPRARVTSITEGLAFDPLFLQPTVDQFRAELGQDNGGIPVGFNSGRREINWDGVPDSAATPNFLPGDFFNSPFFPGARGVELSTPGTGLQVSADSTSTVGPLFSNINPNYIQTFQTFSPERLFSPIGSNVTVVDFFVPGTNTPAVVQSFGAVFTDVDVAGATTIEYFDRQGRLLLTRSAAAADAQLSLSFLGATFNFPVIAQVRITTGTGPLSGKDVSQNGPTDVVALDDFIYAEPRDQRIVEFETTIGGNRAHGDAVNQGGGGVFNDGGRVTLFDTMIQNNLADGVSGSGGGVFSTNGLLTIEESSISGNESARAGGGVEVVRGQAVLTDTVLDGNRAGLLPFGTPTPGNGGGLHVTGNAFTRITRGSIENNQAALEGGGLWNSPTGVMVLDGVDVTGNVALGHASHDGGGGIFNQSGRLVMTGGTVVDNEASGISGSGGGLFSQGGAVTITGTTFDGNTANRAGGGIELLNSRIVMQDTTLRSNSAGTSNSGNPGNGGGLHSTGATRVDIFGGLIENNLAANEGGGLWNSSQGLMILHGGTALRTNVAVGNDLLDGGGGAFNDGGRLAIAGAEFSGNQAFGTGTTGGGLLNAAGVVTIENSTFSGNQSNSAGGGLANFGTLFSTNNTIVLNVSNADSRQLDGGGLYTDFGAFTALRNTIVAGNLTQTNMRGRPIRNDIDGAGSLGSSAFNLIAASSTAGGLIDGVNGNIVGIDGSSFIPITEILDTNLGDNGGTTRTHALTITSRAVNNGSNALAVNSSGGALLTDQRGPGFPRILNTTVDIGAYEL